MFEIVRITIAKNRIAPEGRAASGATLVRYMVDHNVGVSIAGQYEIKNIDSDYFDSE